MIRIVSEKGCPKRKNMREALSKSIYIEYYKE